MNSVAGQLSLYFNGTKVSAEPPEDIPLVTMNGRSTLDNDDRTSPFVIGIAAPRSSAPEYNYANVELDEVKIWFSVMAVNQVQMIYQEYGVM